MNGRSLPSRLACVRHRRDRHDVAAQRSTRLSRALACVTFTTSRGGLVFDAHPEVEVERQVQLFRQKLTSCYFCFSIPTIPGISVTCQIRQCTMSPEESKAGLAKVTLAFNDLKVCFFVYAVRE